MKKQKRNNEDNRGVAIYARKSRITNKGDSIGVQFKQCAEYAKRELRLDENYNFMEYEDKGLSGYYSDRPDFQRMLHDIEMGKIRAVVCYKLDRIGRKTSDLLRLLDFLEKHKVDLLICSNNINTASGVSKIFIQIFAVVAEFERDTLTERITDNMMELAKDGRWLGGNTPTGFTVKRVKTGSGKNKSAYSYLESIPEEKAMIQKLYAVFSETRSIKKTADRMNELGYRTKIGSKFNTSTTRLLLKNPVYCVADEIAYNYFYENGGGVCADLSEFDGQHGLSAYNKTDQEKFEDADSTFISPKFVQLMSAKPVSKWIISVGRHEGFIPSQQWINTQNMLDSIAEKYNRPHRKTNALLAGLVYCPHCGKRLRVISESNRWTNNKPRFKYVCPGYREIECTFQSVDGVLLDEFVVQQLSNLSDEDSEYFTKLLNQRASDIFKNSQNEQELTELKKKKAQLETAIFNQVKNMRDASDDLKRFIQEDIQELSNELREVGILLEKLEDSKQNQMYAVRNIEEIKERLLSFGKYAKGAQPDVLVTLIQSFVERIYIVEKNDERYCHIFIKGCTKEDYDEFFRATGYISGARETGAITSKLPLCDSDECSKTYIFVVSKFIKQTVPAPQNGAGTVHRPLHRPLFEEFQAADKNRLFCLARTNLEEANNLHHRQKNGHACVRNRHHKRPEKHPRTNQHQHFHHRKFQCLSDMKHCVFRGPAGKQCDNDPNSSKQIPQHCKHFVVRNIFGIKRCCMIIRIHRCRSGRRIWLSSRKRGAAFLTESSIILQLHPTIRTIFHNWFPFP